MSKKNQSSDEEIWSKKFGEDYENVEYVSRSERSQLEKNKSSDGMSPMLTGTVIFLALLILGTIFYYVWFSNRATEEHLSSKEPEVETVQKKEEEPKEEPKEKPKEKDEPEEEPEEEPAEESEPAPAPEPEPTPEPEPEPEPVPESEPEPETNPPAEAESGATYTVKPGDNMYRIALNHGLTAAELMALNNLSEETVYVGQVLRVE